jgi:hypothetical protein
VKVIIMFYKILIVFMILSAFTSNAFAAEESYRCTISRIGGSTADSGNLFVVLSDTKGTFNNVSFKIPEGRLNQILAILLTAASNGSTILVKADKEAKTLSSVHYIID